MDVKRCLILSPHYDDAEVSCGATISRLVHEGAEVLVGIFAAQRRLDGSDYGTLFVELSESSNILGFKTDIQSFESRNLLDRRQAVLDVMYGWNKEFKPDLVIGPSLTDTHQDHQVVAQEAFRAFKFVNMLGYDLPWNILRGSFLACFVEITEEDLRLKARALECYKSQRPRDYLTEKAVFAIARTRGLQCGREYAEAFEVYREIW